MGRSPCCEKDGLKKGPWTPEEDQKLLAYIEEHGYGSWRALPAKAGLQRCGKSCRLRWTNYLRPDIKRGKFSLQEEQTIIQLHALLGNRWSAIATHLPKRTDNEIKNYWNTHLKKRLTKMGIDPVTHKPTGSGVINGPSVDTSSAKTAANLSHMAQWESARLEAEARLAMESKLRAAAATASSHTMAPMATHSLDVLRLWPGRHSDLESPTSTLSFQESNGSSIMPLARISALRESIASNSDGFGEDGDWKYISGGVPWFMPTSTETVGFTEMLMNGTEAKICSGESSTGQEESSMQEGDDEGKDYWDGILGLVNSESPPPDLPPPEF